MNTNNSLKNNPYNYNTIVDISNFNQHTWISGNYNTIVDIINFNQYTLLSENSYRHANVEKINHIEIKVYGL